MCKNILLIYTLTLVIYTKFTNGETRVVIMVTKPKNITTGIRGSTTILLRRKTDEKELVMYMMYGNTNTCVANVTEMISRSQSGRCRNTDSLSFVSKGFENKMSPYVAQHVR